MRFSIITWVRKFPSSLPLDIEIISFFLHIWAIVLWNAWRYTCLIEIRNVIFVYLSFIVGKCSREPPKISSSCQSKKRARPHMLLLVTHSLTRSVFVFAILHQCFYQRRCLFLNAFLCCFCCLCCCYVCERVFFHIFLIPVLN